MSPAGELTRRNYLRTAAVAGLSEIATRSTAREQSESDEFETVRVPGDRPTIQEAVDDADGGAGVTASPTRVRDESPVGDRGRLERGRSSSQEVFEERARRIDDGEFQSGDWREQPEPDDRPTMPDLEIRPRPAERETSWDEPQ